MPGTPDLRAGDGRPGWMRWAACRGMGPELFVRPPNMVATAGRKVCRRCAVVDECLSFALADPELMGLWGGTSTRERVRIRAERAAGSHPTVPTVGV